MTSKFDPDSIHNWVSSLFANSKQDSCIIASINDDDCAVIRLFNNYIIVTTDYLNARPIAIELGVGGFWDLGRLVVASNLSDLCGSGAKPFALLTSIMMKRTRNRMDFEQLMKGVKFELEKYDVPLIGGDTKLGDSTAILGVGIGIASDISNLFLRNSAQAKDILWCSGYLGSMSAAVLAMNSNRISKGLKSWAKNVIIEPRIPINLSQQISASGFANGGTDVSDGLGNDLLRLCEASKVGVIINADQIPIEPEAIEIAKKLNLKPWFLAFGLGGDFQFIVSTKNDRKYYNKIIQMGFHQIGELTYKPDCLVKLTDNTLLKMPTIGHRDARNLSFSNELMEILSTIQTN